MQEGDHESTSGGKHTAQALVITSMSEAHHSKQCKVLQVIYQTLMWEMRAITCVNNRDIDAEEKLVQVF